MLEEKMIINRFGILLAEKRIAAKRNISLADVSDQTRIPRKTLFAWASNSVSRYDEHVIDALCEYFNCEVGDLLAWNHVGPRMKEEKFQANFEDEARQEWNEKHAGDHE